MNYKTILMASAAVVFASAANAADITSPMYLPNAGEILSNTSIQYDRASLKHNWGAAEDFRASEEITYGITNNFSVYGEIGNQFDFEGLTNREYNNDHNFDYKIGAKLNLNTCNNWLAQIGASYYTMDPKSWYGHRGNDSRWYKELEANVKLGYDMQNGLLPYTSFTASSNIDEADRTLEYSWFGGVHYTQNKYSVDAGIRYDFSLDQANQNTWWAEAEANYFVKENMTVGIFGDYYLGGTGSDDIDYNYTLGLNAKVLF